MIGDFNGDNIADTLIERFTDSLSVKEVAKYDEVYEYEDILYRVSANNYQSYIQSKNNSAIPHLHGAFLGVHYTENCGDLNGDKRDEIFIVYDHGGFSSVTSGYFYTLADTRWVELNSVGIWTWMFPPTPSACMLSSLFGTFEFGFTSSDSSDAILEKKLKEFHYVKRKDKCAV